MLPSLIRRGASDEQQHQSGFLARAFNALATKIFAEACRHIGIAPRPLLHKRRATDRAADYRRYYSDELAQLVADHFEPDIRLLGYTFDPPATGG